MMPKIFRFNGLLTETGWVSPAFVSVDQNGKIVEISQEKPQIGLLEYVEGLAIPGFQNAHSHAFQYAMAGLAEIHATQQNPDDFWSWRKTMYQLALEIDPQQLEDIASMLYAEMLRYGYTQVAEFHYLHHHKDGEPYTNLAEMGQRLVSAAQRVGIKITLVPMFYQKGGFGKDPQTAQRRFISKGVEQYQRLLEASENMISQYSGARLGMGFHSLRAVEKSQMQLVTQLMGNMPVHIHIAEQKREVEDCLAFYGEPPVHWLYQNFEVNEQWHLVHATHLDNQELSKIAKSGANVVLCPSTEGNLGDGLFRLREYIALNGNWSIGTDSHIGLDPKEELRMLDYGQRLTSHKRNTFYTKEHGDAGSFGFNQALINGRRAMNMQANTSYFAIGESFDAVVIDATHPLMAATSLEKLMSTYIFAADATANLGTIVNGEWRVKENRHTDLTSIKRTFVKTLKDLAIR